MSTLSTHVLDTARGRPAEGLTVTLSSRSADGSWRRTGGGVTNADGRVPGLAGDGALDAGVYRLHFDTGAYFGGQGVSGFYPEASVVFTVDAADDHYHVPLLLSPYGYSTYRGS